MSLDHKMQKIPQNNVSESSSTIKMSNQCSPTRLKSFDLNKHQSNNLKLNSNVKTETLNELDLTNKQNLQTSQEQIGAQVTLDQIENNDPNLTGRLQQVASHQLKNNQLQTNEAQASIIKLILQQQDHSKQYNRFGSVGKSVNQTNLNLLQTHQEPVIQSRNQQGKHNTNTKNFRKIYKMHQSMQKKERSAACDLQLQSRIKMPSNPQQVQNQPSLAFQTMDAGYQCQPQYKLWQPPTVTNMTVIANCANFQSAQTSVRNKKFNDQSLQVEDRQIIEPLSQRNCVHARIIGGPNLIDVPNQFVPSSSPPRASKATLQPRSSIQQTKSTSTMMVGSATGLAGMQFESQNQYQSGLNQVQKQNLKLLSNSISKNVREEFYKTGSQVMDPNQENIVKINNLDLGDSTLENEDKTMSNCGPVATQKCITPNPQQHMTSIKTSEPNQKSKQLEQSLSSNSLERDSNSIGSGLQSNTSLQDLTQLNY